MAGVYQTDGLVSADQAIPDWLVEESISKKAETVTKSQFSDMGLA